MRERGGREKKLNINRRDRKDERSRLHGSSPCLGMQIDWREEHASKLLRTRPEPAQACPGSGAGGIVLPPLLLEKASRRVATGCKIETAENIIRMTHVNDGTDAVAEGGAFQQRGSCMHAIIYGYCRWRNHLYQTG